MLRLRKPYYPRVPNSLAILAAVVLITSSLAGMNSAGHFNDVENQSVAQLKQAKTHEAGSHVDPAPGKSVSSRAVKRSGFRMSFFLFRRY